MKDFRRSMLLSLFEHLLWWTLEVWGIVVTATLLQVAELCEELERTRSRIEKIRKVAEFLSELEEEEVMPAVGMITGKIFPSYDQKVLDVSVGILWRNVATLIGSRVAMVGSKPGTSEDFPSYVRGLLERAFPMKQATLTESPLSIVEVYKLYEAIASSKGPSSRRKKSAIIDALLRRCSPIEAEFVLKNLIGEMRIGFTDGLMEEAVARAFDVDDGVVRRAVLVMGDVGLVGLEAKRGGPDTLLKAKLTLFHPVKPMLAANADTLEEIFTPRIGDLMVEHKLDGARVQIHKDEGNVRIFSRRLTDITDSLPEISADGVNLLKARSAVVEGELIAIGKDDKPMPFQHLMRRLTRVREIEEESRRVRTRLFLFDLLLLDGHTMIDEPLRTRRERLQEVSELPLVTKIVTSQLSEAKAFFEKSVEAGHEGVMVKNPNSPYTPGIRGKQWFKVKKTLDTLDLVVVAAEYGYGRRTGWLSDYHLAAFDPESGRFMEVGKTFKGLTDEEFRRITSILGTTATRTDGHVVTVQPRLVVEVAYNEIQKSPKYESGMALRFARIKRIRLDKEPKEADTLQRVRAIYQRQFSRKATF